MTYIKRLELHGFKSFATKTVFDFPNALNLIVGSNGSGKSNVLDALCFVLGKSSKKDLRAERLGHLVFNGGKTGKPSSNASVSVVFDNAKRIFPYNLDEVKITRIVKHDGTGVYKINDEASNRVEILNVLSSANVDPEGYNIIMQGDIARFVDIAPLERRGLIDEIAGVSAFDEKKRKALNELSKVDVSLKEAGIVLTERERYLKELVNEKRQAESYLKLKQDLRVLRGSLILKKKHDQEVLIAGFDEGINKYNTEIASFDKRGEEIVSEIKKAEESLEKIASEINEKGEKQQVTLAREIESIKLELAKLEHTLVSHENEIKRIDSRHEQIKKDIDGTSSDISSLEAKRKILLREVSDLEKSLRAKKGESSVEEQAESLKLQDEIHKIENELLNKRKLLMDLEAGLKLLSDLNDVKEKYSFSSQQVNKISKDLEKKLNEQSALSAKRAEASDYVDHLKGELLKAQSKMNVLAEMTDRGVKEVLKLRDKGFSGIFGTPSELGIVPDKYQLALKVACGHRLNSLIVSDDLVAKKCIEYLRKNKVGVASFIPLNKVAPKAPSSKARELSTGEGVYGWAHNLIDFDKKYTKAFEFILGSTLVVHDLDTARRIGIGNVRMVTLSGDLVEASGVITGGFRGDDVMGFQSSKVAELIEDLSEKLRKYSRYYSEVSESLNVLQEEIISMREEKARVESLLNDSYARLSELQDKTRDVKDYDKVKKMVSDLGERAEELSKSLHKTVSVDEVINSQKELDVINEALRSKQIELSAVESKLDNVLKREVENLKRISLELKKEKEVFLGEIKSANQKIHDLKAELRLKELDEKKFYKHLKDLYLERDGLKKSHDKFLKEVEKVRTFTFSLKEKIQGINLKRAESLAKLDGLTQAFSEFQNLDLSLPRRSLEEIEKSINELNGKVESFGPVNMKALEVYNEVSSEYEKLNERVLKLTSEKDEVLSLIEKIEKRKKNAFMKIFSAVSRNFSEIFASLSPGGVSKLLLENSEDPFSGGIEVFAKPRGKKVLSVKSLSGGEKTLIALSFIFSIQEFEPAPFYVMDEVDAALDKINSDLLAKLLKTYSSKAQFIVVSHNDNVISTADYLYGVTMDKNGESKMLSLKLPEEAMKMIEKDKTEEKQVQ